MKTSIGAPPTALSAPALGLRPTLRFAARLLLLAMLAMAGCADACDLTTAEADPTPPRDDDDDFVCDECGDDDVWEDDGFNTVTFSVRLTVVPNSADDDDSGK